METKTFLEKVLSGSGNYCVFAARPSDGKLIQKFYDTISAVIDTAYDLDSNGYDAYFALSTFEEPSSRKVDNVKELNSFFLDLDCGPSKDYPDQSSAMVALRTFCATTGLPRPLMINSGRGIHAYWILDEAAGIDNWLPVADKLKRTCAEHKLFADPSVTADAARVLRIPGTHNYKGDPPIPVTFFGMEVPEPLSLEAFAAHLGEDIAPPPSKFIPGSSNAVMDALLGSNVNSFKDIMGKTQQGAGCKQLSNILTKQAETSEPLWRAGLSIAKFCEDGDKAAVMLSANHPDYDAYETTKKMGSIKGPYRCVTFDEYEPGICTDCPNWGKVKSPISLGSRIRAATEEDNVVEGRSLVLPNAPVNTYNIPTYPYPYFRGANGGVYVRNTAPDGSVEEVAVYHNDIYVVRRIRDPEIGEALMIRLHLPKGDVREFTVSLSTVTSREEFRKQMAFQGVAKKRMESLMKYTLDWVNELQGEGLPDEARKQFGWTDADFSSFVIGNQEIKADRVDFNPPSSQTMGLFPAFVPVGTLDKWKETVDFYNRDGFELHQYVLGTAFGSVLMQMSPVNCAGLHVHSKESGVGKTTAMFAASSVWGDPEELVMIKEDTYNSKMHRGEIYHNLPLYIDELTDSQPREISQLAYQITGGKQRARMHGSSNAERYRGEPWRMLSVTTGNASMIERVSVFKAMPKAEAQRMLEVKAERLFSKSEDKEAQDTFSADIFRNYGHAGPEFVKYVMANLEAVQSIVNKVRASVDEKAQLTSENRFWSAHVTHTVAGLIIAHKIGLVKYDTAKVFKWAIHMLKLNKNAVADMSITAEQILNDYINEHWNNVLWIKSTDDLRKGQGGALDSLIVPEALPRGQLVARYETDLKKVYLVPKPLRKWCTDQQINYASFIQDLTNDMDAKKQKIRLSKGTHMQLPPTEVIAVNCAIASRDDGDTEERSEP
tara:strand:- start:3883 stop:6714 length:2832 start_codon:yes stop_codon:yes gene_type:complete